MKEAMERYGTGRGQNPKPVLREDNGRPVPSVSQESNFFRTLRRLQLLQHELWPFAHRVALYFCFQSGSLLAMACLSLAEAKRWAVEVE